MSTHHLTLHRFPSISTHSSSNSPYQPNLTLPQQAARTIVTEVSQHPERAEALSDTLQERIASLNVNEKKARVLLTTLIMEQNAAYMNQIDKVDMLSFLCTLCVYFNPTVSSTHQHTFNIPLSTPSQHPSQHPLSTKPLSTTPLNSPSRPPLNLPF